MNDFQKAFLNAVGEIQNSCVQRALCNNADNTTREDELYSVTADLIYRILELIDGYGNSGIGKINITNCGTGESLKENPFIELHDAASGFITE